MDASIINRALPPGSMRYLEVQYSDESMRRYIEAIFVIESEVRESAIGASHDVAHTRLRWWREEIERLNNGRPQHPATRTLAEYPHAADWSSLQQLVFAADIDLSRMTFDSDRELRAYLERSGGVVQEKVAQLHATPDTLSEAVRERVRKLGAAIRATEMLRDLRRDANAGRIGLPLDALTSSGLTHDSLLAKDPPASLRKLVAERASSTLESLRQTIDFSAEDRARVRPVLVMARLHERLLEKLAAGSYNAAAPVQLGNFERVWLAWRAAVRAR